MFKSAPTAKPVINVENAIRAATFFPNSWDNTPRDARQGKNRVTTVLKIKSCLVVMPERLTPCKITRVSKAISFLNIP